MNVLKKIWAWFDDRTGTSELLGPVLTHKVPNTDWKTGWWYVFGSVTLLAFIVQVVTGIGLATNYVTSTGDAYNSLNFITHDAPFGWLLRGMHFWGGSAMVLFIGAHAMHSFLIGSYKFPREVNWLSGVVLLLLTLAMGFTGQLLRWDQTAVWSVVVAAAQAANAPFVGRQLSEFLLAGDTIGGATLSRFFSFHVFFIPAIIFAVVGLHLWLVIRNGISEPPKRGQTVDPKTYRKWYHDMLEREGVPFWPDAAWRDAAAIVVVLIGIFVLGLVLGPPELGRAPDPTLLQAYPKPDWYLLWYFSVLALMPPGLESTTIILGPLLFGVLLIALPFFANKGERTPSRRPWAVGIAILTVIIIFPLWITGEQAPWSPNFDARPLTTQQIGQVEPVAQKGAQLFFDKGCAYCHKVGESTGGNRGPNLAGVGSRYSEQQLDTRILNGGTNMPAYANILKPDELEALVAFLQTRKSDQPQIATGPQPAAPAAKANK
jgi:ubiquinol-cytochrome c reductase cytochrome b subunit